MLPTPKKHIQSLFTLFLSILRSPVLWNTYDQKLAEPSLKHHKTPKKSGPAMAGLQGSTALLGFNTESSKNPIKFGQASVPTRQCLWRHGIDRQRSETLV